MHVVLTPRRSATTDRRRRVWSIASNTATIVHGRRVRKVTQMTCAPLIGRCTWRVVREGSPPAVEHGGGRGGRRHPTGDGSGTPTAAGGAAKAVAPTSSAAAARTQDRRPRMAARRRCGARDRADHRRGGVDAAAAGWLSTRGHGGIRAVVDAGPPAPADGVDACIKAPRRRRAHRQRRRGRPRRRPHPQAAARRRTRPAGGRACRKARHATRPGAARRTAHGRQAAPRARRGWGGLAAPPRPYCSTATAIRMRRTAGRHPHWAGRA